LFLLVRKLVRNFSILPVKFATNHYFCKIIRIFNQL